MAEEAGLFAAEELLGAEAVGAVAGEAIGGEAIGAIAGETLGADALGAGALDTVLEGGVGPIVEGAAAPAVGAATAGTLGADALGAGLDAGTVLEGGVGPVLDGAASPLGGLPAAATPAAVDPALTETINAGATSTGASSLPGTGPGLSETADFTQDEFEKMFPDRGNPPAADTSTTFPTTPPTKKGGGMQGAVDTALKYGPLALGTAGALTNRGASKELPAQLNALGGPQRDAATSLISAYNTGKLPDAQEGAFAQAERDAIAKSRAYFAKAGLSDSSMAQGQESDIHAQFAAKRQQALMTMLTTGLDTLNITDENTRSAILTELQINKDMGQQTQAFLNAAGQLAARQPQLTKAAA